MDRLASDPQAKAETWRKRRRASRGIMMGTAKTTDDVFRRDLDPRGRRRESGRSADRLQDAQA